MSAATNSFIALEKHRMQLEENVEQLKKALQHWRTWDAEYEALKEEVEAIPDPCKPDDLCKIRAEFDGELLIAREIDGIFGWENSRSRDQIINVLQRRIDYVGKNVASLEKQLEAAENKYAAAMVISQPDAVDEYGQPITEILEELDDHDNVVSYRLNQPGKSLAQVQQTLEKAGVHTLSSDTSTSPKPEESGPVATQQADEAAAKSSLTPSPNRSTSAPTTTPTPSVKKSVSFSEDVQDPQPLPAKVSARAKRVDRIMKTAKEQEDINLQNAVIPEDEDEDDAELRRQMLQYSMGQVGAVVAEIDLEEDISDNDDSGVECGDNDVDEGDDNDDDDDDDEYDDDDDYDDDEEEEEDKFGRFTGRVITDKYRRRLLELEQRLGVKSRFTEQAERDEATQSRDEPGGIGRITVNQGTDSMSSSSRPAPTKSNLKESRDGDVEEKKGVRFAEALDIAPETEAEAESAPMHEREAPLVEPLSDIVERTTPTATSSAKPARKQSRFRAARDVNPVTESGVIPKGPFDVPMHYVQQEQRTVPTGPEGSTIADKLVERDTPLSHSVIAPDEFDDTMAQREVADEYHRMRRKFIQRDGGFLKEDERVIQPLDEADGRETMSRFKAARLSQH
ncbi:hypothetical protein E4U13_007552 [Claviceps humidiphila]|uniref:DUF3835 domain-containing protein n=1 Tax=Claviceps humidiphila TaxID=1294629 RepID=A0A9P7Q5K6_9HYPO|nr:hypothetical protein E4U13_007552 [Claviceps humidiphila]